MNILIVGGLGYIGGRFAAHLKKQYPNYSIHLTTRKKQYPAWAAPHFTFHQLDLMEATSINQCLDTLYPEVVFHLGALQQADCEKDPYLAHKINVDGTKHLVKDCIEHGVKKYVYLSTFQIYGIPQGIITEQTHPHPLSVYAKTKFEGEQIVQQSSMQTLVLRISNAYGYPMDTEIPESVWALAMNAFVQSVIKERKIQVRSNQYRDFVTLEDVCRSMEHLVFNTDAKGIFNIGGHECLSIEQAAKRVASVYEETHPGQKVAVTVASDGKMYQPFQYKMERLIETGFQHHGYRKEEIQKIFQLLQKG